MKLSKKMHSRNWKIILVLVFLILMVIPISYAQENIIIPKNIIKVVFEGRSDLNFHNMWVERNYDNMQFYDFNRTKSFNSATCNHKYLYKVMDNSSVLYEDYFCARFNPFTQELINMQQSLSSTQTLILMPFFDEAERIDIHDSNQRILFSISLEIFGKTKDKPIELVKVSPRSFPEPSPEEIENARQADNLSSIEKIPEVEHTEDIKINNLALLKICGGILFLILLIAVFIARLKHE